MLRASKTVGEFLDELIADMGLFETRDRAFYRDRLSEALIFLWSAVIRMRASGEATPKNGLLPCGNIPVPDGAGAVHPRDVLAVYCGGRQLRYLPPEELASAAGMPYCFYTVTPEGIRLSHTEAAQPMEVVFTLRPPIYGESDESRPVPLPDEFLPMLAAKVRGEVYRLANEDGLCAKWLAVYNAGLADLYDYLAERRRR